jgi:hypothetical protein
VETARHSEPGEAWGARGEEWVRLERLLELARTAPREALTPTQREQFRERLLERLERNLVRRRRARVLIAAASSLSLGALLWTLVRARLIQRLS